MFPLAFAVPLAWKVGAAAAAGIATAAGTGYAAGRSSNEKENTRTQRKKKLSQEMECSMIFGLKLMKSVAHVNGDYTKGQDDIISKWIESIKSQWELSEEQKIKFDELKDRGYISFSEMEATFRSVSEEKDSGLDEIFDKLSEVARADNQVADEERWFVLKARLEFKRKVSVPFFLVAEKSYHENINDFVTVLTVDEANRFRSIDGGEIETGKIMTKNFGTSDVLVPINELQNIDIEYDRETEVLEALRMVGAKRVVIVNSEEDLNDSDVKQKAEVEGGKDQVFSAKASEASRMARKTSKATDSTIEVNFSKTTINRISAFFSRFLGSPEKQFKNLLDNSKWIKQDKKLSWLVNQALDQQIGNNVTQFVYKADYQSEADKITEVSGAIEATGLGYSGSLNAEAESRLKRMKNNKRYFYAEFH